MGLEDRLRKLEGRLGGSPGDEPEFHSTVEEARERVYSILHLPSDGERERFWSLTPEEREEQVSEHKRWLHSAPEGRERLRAISETLKRGGERWGA